MKLTWTRGALENEIIVWDAATRDVAVSFFGGRDWANMKTYLDFRAGLTQEQRNVALLGLVKYLLVLTQGDAFGENSKGAEAIGHWALMQELKLEA